MRQLLQRIAHQLTGNVSAEKGLGKDRPVLRVPPLQEKTLPQRRSL
jgi:hypothetical protein